MLSYRHAFHAGNHADILKHISLMLTLESMCKKEKPFTAIDCNAGGGFYYLDSDAALKTGEAQEGILKLLSNVSDGKEQSNSDCGNNDSCSRQGECQNPIERYIALVKPYLELGIYPGSPEIIRSFLREQDKAILIELHNTEIEILKSHINDNRISIQHRNCYEGLNAITPPQIRRGFLLMDPSYEVVSDYENVASSLVSAQKKWNVGVQLLWYPLLRHREGELQMMLDSITAAAERNGLEWFTQEFVPTPSTLEASSTQSDGYGLYGSGMLFVNPPWKLQENLSFAVEKLKTLL